MRLRRPGAQGLLALPGIATLAVVVGLPGLAVARSFIGVPQGNSDATPSPWLAQAWGLTIAWSMGIALVATLVAWRPARALRRGSWWLRAIVLAAALVPAWVTFYGWWRVLRPGNAIADAAMAGGWISELRMASVAIALVAWTWPIAAAVIAFAGGAGESATRTLLSLDSLRWSDKIAAAWRADRWGLACAVAAVAAILFGESATFDAAQVPTAASELRAMDAAGASADAVLRAAWPAVGVAFLASALLVLLLRRALPLLRAREATEPSATHKGGVMIVALVAVATLLPLALLLWDTTQVSEWQSFTQLHLRASRNSLVMGGAVGALGAAIAIAVAVLGVMSRWRTVALIAVGCLVMLVVPATTVALACAQVWRGSAAIYDTLAVVALAEAGRFSLVAVACGAWCGATVTREARDSWELGGAGLADFIRMARPQLLAAAGAGATLLFALAIGETSVAARLQPPGADWLAASMLNAIHYQDASAVCAALPWLGMIALGAALVLMLIMRGALSAANIRLMLLATCALLVASCGAADQEAPLPTDIVIGRAGHTDGRFFIPRAMAVEPSTGAVFVIDKDARVQRFSEDGKFELSWTMPKFDKGKPTGISISPQGLIYVADTHEQRVLVFDRDGHQVAAFGQYGMGPGQFIYPCDIAFGAGGEIFVAEYGGNDRIQVFDKDHRFLRTFGAPGSGAGEFARPQSIDLSPDGREMFVADACNHRIQVFSATGEFLRIIGSPGRAPGELAYPYGVQALNDGSLLVAEFGNCRLQRLDQKSGRSISIFGGGGHEIGRLNAPWAVDVETGRALVLDSGNARVQSLPLAALR